MDDITPRDRREVEKWLVRMLDDPDRHRPALSRWLLEKPGRRILYERLLRSVEDAGQALPFPLLEQSPSVAMPRRSKYLPVGVAAALLILAFGSVLYFRAPNFMAGGGQANAEMTLATRVGEVREEKLPDGSVLTLDTDTRVHVHLTGGDRLLHVERGRVRFSVAAGAQPFVVQIADSQVRAAGGIFDVSYRNRIAVNLLKGNVAVHLPGWRDSAAPSRLLRLRAGEILTFSAEQSATATVMSASPSEGQWISGVKSFDEVPIREVIAEANNYSRVQIILADPALGGREIFGDIRIRDIDSVATAIASFLDAHIDRSRPGQLIIQK